jgi:dihydroorotate dehydrogenase (NAD+) catalytic subunit
MIELAPNHKYGLAIDVPLMPASGAFGYGDAYGDLVDISGLGAIVTNPISLQPRQATQGRRIAVHEDSFVVHTGWPNPGARRVIRDYGATWERLTVPVIVHLLANHTSEVARAAALFSAVPNVRAIELGFTAAASRKRAVELVTAAAVEGDLPVIAQIPFDRVDDLAPYLARQGVDALTLTAPPRAVLPVDENGEDPGVARFGRGRLYGRALFPLLLNTLSRWAVKLPVPVIACGGIASPDDALACLTLGAAAVQVDALLWRDPSLLDRIARALAKPRAAYPAVTHLLSPNEPETEENA